MATSLKISGNEGRIDHLQFNTYHMVQRLWKLVQWILRYFGSERTSPVWHKIGCHSNVPWNIEKNSDPSSASKRLSYGVKIANITRGLRFAYDTKLVTMATYLRNWKSWTWSRKFTQIPSIWWKDRENRSSRYWDSFAYSKKIKKKKKKLTQAKYIALPASLSSGLNKWWKLQLTATHEKTEKNNKKRILPAYMSTWCWVVSPFYKFAVLDAWLLTQCISCSFCHLYLLFYYHLQYTL